MIVRLAGMAIAGLLAVACVLGIAIWMGKMAPPAWLPFSFGKSGTRGDAQAWWTVQHARQKAGSDTCRHRSDDA